MMMSEKDFTSLYRIERMMIMSFGVTSALNSLNRTHSSAAKHIQNIATGTKYSTAANGASEYAISQRMYANIGAIRQSNVNAQNSNSMLKTASGAIDNTIQSLSSLQQTLINAKNGTNGSTDLAALQKSVDQTISQINENANVTYNGQKLLDGSAGSVTVAGAWGDTEVPLGNMTSEGLGLTDAQGNSTINVTDADSLESALNTVTSALNSAVASQGTLTEGLDATLDEATTLGAYEQGLEYQSANYTVAEENLTDAVSTLSDTDIASEITKLKSDQTTEQLAMFGIKAMQTQQASALKLLG